MPLIYKFENAELWAGGHGDPGQVWTCNGEATAPSWATPPAGSGGNTGSATVDFGAFPGSPEASVSIAGQTAILSGSIAQAWIRAVATADHSEDEHRCEPIAVTVGAVTAGQGFSISLKPTELKAPRLYGSWSVAWMWS